MKLKNLFETFHKNIYNGLIIYFITVLIIYIIYLVKKMKWIH